MKYDWIDCYVNSFAVVSKKNKWGFINEKGEQICELIYDKCKRILSDGGFNSQKAWNVIAVIEHFFDKIVYLNTIGHNKNAYYKYYSCRKYL